MRIVIVEDEALIRDALRKACSLTLGHEVVGDAGTGLQAIGTIRQTGPDLLILDLRLPDGDGLDILLRVRSVQPLLPALVVSSLCNEYTVYRVECARVQGFVDKSTETVAELGRAIAAIGRGATYFSAHYRELSALRRRNPASFDKVLSAREITVLALIGIPFSDPEIADTLGLSAETVGKHRFNIMGKLSINSRTGLARYARERGMTR